MKRFLRLGVLAALAFSAKTMLADGPQQQLVVLTSGGKVSVALADSPEISFAGDNGAYTVSLSSNAGQQQWAFDGVEGWYFTRSGNSAIAVAEADEVVFGFDPTSATLFSSSEGIAVYDVAGRLASSTTGEELSVAHLNGGIYIAVSGSKSVKFIKR